MLQNSLENMSCSSRRVIYKTSFELGSYVLNEVKVDIYHLVKGPLVEHYAYIMITIVHPTSNSKNLQSIRISIMKYLYMKDLLL